MKTEDTTSRLAAFAIAEISAAAQLAETLTVPADQEAAKARVVTHLRVASGVLSSITRPAA